MTNRQWGDHVGAGAAQPGDRGRRCGGPVGRVDELVARAVAASPKHGSMADIEHVVILIQENRSFDHYFGTYSGVRGFGDQPRRAASSTSAGSNGRTLHPFHLDDRLHAGPHARLGARSTSPGTTAG